MYLPAVSTDSVVPCDIKCFAVSTTVLISKPTVLDQHTVFSSNTVLMSKPVVLDSFTPILWLMLPE